MKVISLERELNPPELVSSESFSVQIETVRLKGQTTINLVEKLLAMVTNLTAKATPLQSDKAVLEVQICEMQDLLSAKSCHMEPAVGTSSSKPGIMSYKDALASNQHSHARTANTSKSYRHVISSIQKPTAVNAVA
jgi:hypothetical protein